MPVAGTIERCPEPRPLRGESIVRRKIVRTLLAAWLAWLAMAASAQTTDPGQDGSVDAARMTRSIATPGAQDSAGVRGATGLVEPANVLEDAPRDKGGRLGSACAYDPRKGQLSATCRRQLEIARSP
jgi:hypothetical protein